MHHFDWFNHGGLYREVELLRLPARLHPRLSACASCRTDRCASARRRRAVRRRRTRTARSSIPELGVDADDPGAARRGPRSCSSAAPQLWSPATPTLYDVVVRCGDDVVRDRIGFREIARRRPRHPAQRRAALAARASASTRTTRALGKVSTEADVRRRFADARELGCNFLRLAALPAPRARRAHRRRDGLAAVGGDPGLLGDRLRQPRRRWPTPRTSCAN